MKGRICLKLPSQDPSGPLEIVPKQLWTLTREGGRAVVSGPGPHISKGNKQAFKMQKKILQHSFVFIISLLKIYIIMFYSVHILAW